MGKKLFGLVKYKPSDAIQTILESPEANRTFAELLEKKNQSIEKSKTKAQTILSELTSSYSFNALSLSYWIVRGLQKSMFDGIVIHGNGLDAAREISKQDKILFFLPNHKSHMDYLLISYILFNHDIAPPHIAAGVNLSFWPMGPIFRKTGAYFIRRKISGNFLYTKLLEFYFSWMLRHKISQEFYMEGGRSRDGKIREVQSGVFTLFAEQAIEQKLTSQIYIIPTTITYDRVPEMQSLLEELKGSSKKKESVFSLFASLSKLITKHGNVHLHFGQPLAFDSLVQGEFTKKTFQNLSKDIFTRIQKQKALTLPEMLALILLSQDEEMSSNDVLQRMLQLIKLSKPCQNCMSDSFVNAQKNWDQVLQKYASYGWFEKKYEHLFIQKPKRIEMNYYKNDVVPFLIPFSLGFFEKALAASDFLVVQNILQHKFPYAEHAPRTASLEMEDFLQIIHVPMFVLYREILKLAIQNSWASLASSETHMDWKRILEDKDFAYPEMITTEAIRSAAMFFHQHADEFKDNPDTIANVLEKILS